MGIWASMSILIMRQMSEIIRDMMTGMRKMQNWFIMVQFWQNGMIRDVEDIYGIKVDVWVRRYSSLSPDSWYV